VAERLIPKVGELWNFYGPTETTVYSVAVRIASEPGEPVRIGRPLRNTQTYILDGQGAPVPIGATGELCIGGDGLARGYVNAPELTEERFVANPFRPGERMYRTGDFARYLADGCIVWLGRIDQQVKIHGYRVELGEIETALRTIAGIRDAVVTTWVDGGGDKQIVAHLVADAAMTDSVAGIRERLKDLLPQAVIPPFYVFTDQFPVSPAGKIDRAALPPPRPGERPQANGGPPVTSTERLLADIWAKLLGVPVVQIGRDDDFMELGGHSLLMTQLMVDVRKVFGVTFGLRDFFATTVLRKFAEFVGKLERTSDVDAGPVSPLALMRSPDHARDRMAFLRREGELPSDIAPARGLTFRPAPVVATVLLTGASGFLGSYILSEILETSAAHVYCLVRAKPGVNGKSRIADQLRNYCLWKDDPEWQSAWEQRVHVVAGDVILPRLGLADGAYAALAREVDCIIHSAAHVNFIYPYEALRATNVFGLHEIIRFAFFGRIKALHYLSTAAIWPMGSELTFFESDPIDQGKLLNLGYDEAKWVGEQCLVNAMERGLPVARYRPGEVGGDSESGRCVLNHFLFSSLKGFLQFGALPPIDTYIDVAPVDYVAKAIVHMALHKNPVGRAFHLTNPRSGHMKEAMQYLRNEGYQFDELPFDELRRRLIMSPGFSENALFPYQAALEGMDERSFQLPRYDTEQARSELEGSGIVCPPADEALLQTYLKYLREVDFLPAPSALQPQPGLGHRADLSQGR
ncbi:MAG: thioester reductase domain-containing protein, partial [Alphaproteobacteria bacterium]|nr:thioester reductase domain-containing protein [Alphaproteobacteria bacterium]